MITYYHDFFGDARGKSLPISWSFIECRFCILFDERSRRGDGGREFYLFICRWLNIFYLVVVERRVSNFAMVELGFPSI
ncbi:MAG: hypothetical protein F6K39_14445 [Okeania sp. SIO3B3]|nr:hypothetical protein [Okeania sp. SIO3B3]